MKDEFPVSLQKYLASLHRRTRLPDVAQAQLETGHVHYHRCNRHLPHTHHDVSAVRGIAVDADDDICPIIFFVITTNII